eukprot:1469339-Pleurochrysis_carterae.AAC.1
MSAYHYALWEPQVDYFEQVLTAAHLDPISCVAITLTSHMDLDSLSPKLSIYLSCHDARWRVRRMANMTVVRRRCPARRSALWRSHVHRRISWPCP